ncbi:MAG: isochorismatase family cysteine hydrolase [Spirochaetales bacterium]
MAKALLIIDYNNDFVAQDGKLTCGEPGQAIDEKIAELVESFNVSGDFIINACDNHDEDELYSPEVHMFPPHCCSEYGKSLYGKTKNAVEKFSKDRYIYIPKVRYSAFVGTPLDVKLKERNINELHLVGVCTDICVLHCAIDAYNLGYKIVVYKDCVASFNEAGHNYCLTHFTDVLGATVI